MTSNSKAEIDCQRLLERLHIQNASTPHKISAEQHSNHVVSILDYCEEAQYSQSTAFYAITYLDVFVNKIQTFETSRLPMVALCCVWIAVKFNEPRSKSQCLSISTIHAALNSDGSPDDIRQIETIVLQMLNNKLNITTSYDYIQPFFQRFPWFSALKNLMPELLSFAISIPELTRCNSENLFYGVLLGCLQIKNCVLSALQVEVLSTHINNRQSAELIATRFTQAYYEVSGDQNTKDSVNNSMTP